MIELAGLAPAQRLVLAGLVLGLAFGAVAQQSHFCTMGAISDARLFGSWRRVRGWGLAFAAALLGTMALVLAGPLRLAETGYHPPALAPLGLVLGGLMFGFGMVLAGGCVSRNLVRLGGGSLKALVALLATGLAGAAALVGVLAPPRLALQGVTFDIGDLPGGLGPLLPWLGIALALLLATRLLADRQLRRARAELLAALVIGGLVPLGWLATTVLAADPFEPVTPASLTYVGPTARTLTLLVVGSTGLPFGVALVAGTVLGALAAALVTRQLRLEGFTSTADLGRHLVGGALMGFGGVTAGGCTIGHGITGLATLAPASLLALAGIVGGALWALFYLERGRLVPSLPRGGLAGPVADGDPAGRRR
jgi:uncharacterized membrane protein YedE/YeeE